MCKNILSQTEIQFKIYQIWISILRVEMLKTDLKWQIFRSKSWEISMFTITMFGPTGMVRSAEKLIDEPPFQIKKVFVKNLSGSKGLTGEGNQ